ncbi:MAG: hypothetical protein LBT31_10760 [Synergistaceae bacterium]|jgi:hypothetical protein|nr:hypothetical protein [Synergistaceae bacterium]
MEITGREKIDNCIHGEFVFKYFFDAEWTKDIIGKMASLGELKYYGSFPVPMFRVRCPDGTVIKGVQSTNECRAIFPRSCADTAALKFETLVREIFQEPMREG